MKKELTRLFSVLLAAVLVFGTLPVSAMGTDVADPPASAADDVAVDESAAEPEEQSAEEEAVAVQQLDSVDGYDMNVMLLDCGRKYYSVNSIETFIDEASAAGFNYIQLVVGNEGLRFLLDDMSLTVNDATYKSDAVKAAIQTGNADYNKTVEDTKNKHAAYNPEKNELTQTEMDAIIAYAHQKGMGVIPCINSPGHMYTILEAAQSLTGSQEYAYKTASEIDVSNDDATDFTKALLKKYMNYFAGKGCRYFNMGADEYSFSQIAGTFKSDSEDGMYAEFITYMNEVAAQIKDCGMKPMAFNDGVYYGSETSAGTVDKDIIVFYWSYGYGRNQYWGYAPAATSLLTKNENSLINTNQYYYWALGKSDYQCDSTRASQFNYTKFDDSSIITNPKGSMFCVWSDFPGDGTEDYVIQKTEGAIAAFGATLPKVNTPEEATTPTEPEEPDEITISNGDNKVTEPVSLQKDGKLTLTASVEATWSTKDTDIVSLSAVEESTAALAATDETTVTGTAVEVTALKTGTATITATAGDKSTSVSVSVTADSSDDLSNVDPLTIEYWITNAKGTGTTTKANSCKIYATANGVNSGEGAAIYDLLADKTIESENPDGRVFWQARMLNRTTDEQTNKEGVDKTSSGVEFTKVRYLTTKWQVYNVATSEWTDVYANPQYVVYYMETLDISNTKTKQTELDVRASDWGTRGTNIDSFVYPAYYSKKYTTGSGWNKQTKYGGLCSLSFQIVYETGSKNPVDETAGNLITKTYFYNQWDKRGVGTLNLTGDGYEIYKVTATTGTLDYTEGNTNCQYTDTEISEVDLSWAKDETTVFEVDKNNSQKSVTIKNDTSNPTVNTDAEKNLSWSRTTSYGNGKGNNAILIRIYVTSKADDNLTVHYLLDDENKTEFHNYQIGISAKGLNGSSTAFDENFGVTKDADEKVNGLQYNSVINFKGNEETVEWQLETMPSIKPEYRYAKYELVNAYTDKDEGGKNAYLIYRISTTSSFVIDFGTPLTLKPAEVVPGFTTNNAEITGVSVGNAKYGTVTVNDTDKSITYTPSPEFASSKDGDLFTVTYTGKKVVDEGTQSGSITYVVHIYPASNVLYEENFLSKTEGDNTWTLDGAAANNTQQTQQAKEKKNAFGYDESYKDSQSSNGVWSIGNLSTENRSTPLTTSFYGNTFDLIGDCGPSTGRIFLIVTKQGADGKKHTTVVDVDTRYDDGETEVIHQVPLAHVKMTGEKYGYDDALCTVKIYAAGLDEIKSTATAVMAAADVDDNVETDDLLDQILAENGLSIEDVDYITTSVADTLDVAATPAAVDLYSAALATDGTNNSGYPAGDHVAIDGFRVYRTTDENDAVAQNYPEDEQKVTYENIWEVANESFVGFTDKNTAVEGKVKDYIAAGGPQNEIYLKQGNALVFKIPELKKRTIQVSLRAVKDNTSVAVDGKTISSVTEMYYEITSDENGTFTIVNKNDSILAVGNVKLPSGITTDGIVQAKDMDNAEIVNAIRYALHGAEEPDPEPEPEPETFEPATFDVSGNAVSVIRNKVVTLKIKVSDDVAYVTVNGVKYTRTGLQSAFQKTRTIRVINTIPRDAEKTYEIIAYNADGVASKTVTKTVK